MDRPWLAERTIDRERAARLVASHWPALAGAAVEPYGEGWDNSAFLVDGAVVFRFPRRALAVELMETEIRCLPAIARSLALRIPVPRFVGRTDDPEPWPFAGYDLLAGVTVCRAGLGDAARASLAEPLATFLRALHSIDVARARGWGAPPDRHRRLELPYRADRARAQLVEADRAGLLEPGVRRGLERALEATPLAWRPRAAALCHGDLYARHVLVDDDSRAAGVIDWGDLHVGDGTVDLAVAHSLLPPDAHGTFRAAYGPIDADAWSVARTRAIVTHLAATLYADEVGDGDLAAEGRWALANIARG